VIGALMRVQLDSGVPVFSSVLTPQQFHEHATHLQFFSGHFEVKGVEVARACVRTLDSLERLLAVGLV
jgi:6,7-dimethyl-8-ribityllumazine synthase